MGRATVKCALAVVGIAAFFAQSAWAANVKVTPLGGVDGEFCRLDRAMIFEDPNGTRILYDAGRSVAAMPQLVPSNKERWVSTTLSGRLSRSTVNP